MHYVGFVPDLIIMGKAAQTAMVLANLDTVAAYLPTSGSTTSPTATLLRSACVMDAMLRRQSSPYYGIAARIPEYHAGVLQAIQACVAAEQARLDGRANVGDQHVQVDRELWGRCIAALTNGAGGTRMPLFWGGNLVWFCHESVSDAVFGQLLPGVLGDTSSIMRAIITFRPPTEMAEWLAGWVWVHTVPHPRKKQRTGR